MYPEKYAPKSRKRWRGLRLSKTALASTNDRFTPGGFP
nr:MAG TPA: hypothetical protein [Caudoviricetes sp.]